VGKGRGGYSGKIRSINKSAAKFLLTRVAVDSAAFRIPNLSSQIFPVPVSHSSFPIPAGYAISSLCAPSTVALAPHKLLTHAAVKKKKKKQQQ